MSSFIFFSEEEREARKELQENAELSLTNLLYRERTIKRGEKICQNM